MCKLLESPRIAMNDFRQTFQGANCADLGNCLMYVISSCRQAQICLDSAKKHIEDNSYPLVAIGNSLGFHYHCVYIKPII